MITQVLINFLNKYSTITAGVKIIEVHHFTENGNLEISVKYAGIACNTKDEKKNLPLLPGAGGK